jgi:Domain of unknown function (DUF4387)
MNDQTTVGDLAAHVRSKNAGPFWMTLDVFLDSDESYNLLMASGVLDRETVAALYLVEPDDVQIFLVPSLRVIKISFPRRVVAGSFTDRDQHAGQQHVPLAQLRVPLRPLTEAEPLVA